MNKLQTIRDEKLLPVFEERKSIIENYEEDFDMRFEEEMNPFAPKPPKTHFHQVFHFQMKGMSFFFLNDFGNNFYPVFSIKIDKVQYNHLMSDKGQKFLACSRIKTHVSYFNVKAGFWEPFIEGLQGAADISKDLVENRSLTI